MAGKERWRVLDSRFDRRGKSRSVLRAAVAVAPGRHRSMRATVSPEIGASFAQSCETVIGIGPKMAA